MGNLLTFIFQVALFFVLINLNWLVGYLIIQRPEYPSEYSIVMTFFYFIILVFFNNLLMRIINRNWFDKIITLITATIYTITWIEDIDSFTFHALVFIFSGVIPIFLKKKIERIIRRKLEFEL